MPRFCVEGGKAAFSVFSPWMRILRLLLSSGSTLAVFSMSCIGEVFMAPKYDSQGHVLDFVQHALIGFGSHSSVAV